MMSSSASALPRPVQLLALEVAMWKKRSSECVCQFKLVADRININSYT